jgi:DNA-directed RNA polymerase subunit RPC12/RpoP
MNPKLMPCPDCGHQVSKKAATCPTCGHRFAFGLVMFSAIFWAILALALFGFIIAVLITPLLSHP